MHEPVSYERVPGADPLRPLPAPGEPVRVAFAGAADRDAPFLPPADLGRIAAPFVVAGDDDALRAIEPDLVVAFEADAATAAAAHGVPVLAVLRSAGPVPAGAARALSPHPDGWARGALWRCAPLPIADALYGGPSVPRAAAKVILVGERAPAALEADATLRRVAAAFDLAPALPPIAADVAVHLPAPGSPPFDPLLAAHLAAGQLLLSQRLEPGFGLDAGTHYVELRDADDLDLRLHQLRQRPESYQRVRLEGHRVSHRLRASVVWPRLIDDLLRDLAVFGEARSVA